MGEREEYAKVGWCAGDVQHLKPAWSLERCEGWLREHDSDLRQAMIQAGWHEIERMLEVV